MVYRYIFNNLHVQDSAPIVSVGIIFRVSQELPSCKYYKKIQPIKSFGSFKNGKRNSEATGVVGLTNLPMAAVLGGLRYLIIRLFQASV
jgi:hypothetical protein